ncbi:MAG: histidine phosphatase family protein [Actinomycetota bacterium]
MGELRHQYCLTVGQIVIVQHGEKERMPGDPGLTSAGHRQAAQTARHLCATVPAARLVSSPLRRALETAEVIGLETGLPLVVDDRLRERINWDGSTPLETFLETWSHMTADPDWEPEPGISSASSGERMLQAITDHHRGGSVVIVVSHGGATVDLLRRILGDGAVRARCPDLISNGVPNCALTWLTHDGNGWMTGDVARTAHLPRAAGSA